MKSNRSHASGDDNRFKELEEENAKLKGKLAKQEEGTNQKTAWIEEEISRGLAILRSKIALPEDSGLEYHYFRIALSIIFLSSEEDKEKREELRDFGLKEIAGLCDWWLDRERGVLGGLKGLRD
jgi:hypothetical protein